MLSRPLSTSMVLCCDYFVMKKIRIWRKTYVFEKNCIRFGCDLDFSWIKMQTSLPNCYRSVVVNFRGNRLPNETWLTQKIILLFKNSFASSHCFVHHFFIFLRIRRTTVFDVVLENEITFWMIQLFAVTFSLFWNCFVDCWTSAQKTLLQLGILKHFFSEWVSNRKAPGENLAIS